MKRNICTTWHEIKGEKGARERWGDATRRIQLGDRKWYVLVYGQTADAAARLPIAHVICTYQYEPCQIYHSARYTRMRFRARSPPRCGLYSISRFPSVCRRRARHKQARRGKKASFPRAYRVTMTRKKQRGNGRQTGQVRGVPDYTRTWSFQQVRSMLVCVMFDTSPI